MTTPARNKTDEKAIAFFGTWMVIGLFLDGWAHNVRKPETFFSPWHGILYSGFGAAVAYFTIRDFVARMRGKQIESAPPDRLMIAGLATFVVGAVGDGIWHSIFGIEVSLEALLSPTHLALMIGGLLMLGSAYRAGVKDPSERWIPPATTVTMTLSAAVLMFFTQYLNAFRFRGWFADRGVPQWKSDENHVFVVAAVFVTFAILLGLVYLIVRRWSTPRGTFAFAFGVLATMVVGLNGFRHSARLNIVYGIVAGLVVDVLIRRVRPRDGIARARVFTVLVPLVLSGLWVGSLYLQNGVKVAAEIWTGTIVLVCLEGVGLGLLAFPSKQDEVIATPAPAATASGQMSGTTF